MPNVLASSATMGTMRGPSVRSLSNALNSRTMAIVVDSTVAKPHQAGYGVRATAAGRDTAAVRRTRSALLSVRTPAWTAAGPSRWNRKKVHDHPAFRTRLTASARR